MLPKIAPKTIKVGNTHRSLRATDSGDWDAQLDVLENVLS